MTDKILANKSNIMRMLPLFLVLFIDTLGAAFIIPLLAPLFIDSTTSILPVSAQYGMRTFLYGLTLGIYSIAAFFGAPILGDLSDKIGRKKILLLCLVGACIGYLLCAVGVVTHSVSLLVLGRIIDGFTAGSLSIAQASIIDVSSKTNKTKNIGYILLAISLGYMLGPLIAGTLSNPRWATWFDLTTPLYFAAILSFFNVLFLIFCFKETYIPQEKKTIHLLAGLTVFASAFKIPSIRSLMFGFLFLQLGWATFVQFIGLFLTLKYHFSANEVGVFLGCVGVGFTLAFCYLLEIVTRYFPLLKIAVVSISMIALCILAILSIDNEISVWVLSIPAATGLAIAFSVLTSLFSDQVDKDKQGWIMGLTGAIGAFSFGMTGLIAGIMVDFGVTIPIWFAFICLAASALTVYWSGMRKAKSQV